MARGSHWGAQKPKVRRKVSLSDIDTLCNELVLMSWTFYTEILGENTN